MTHTIALSPRQHRLWEQIRNRTKITTGDIHTANRNLKVPKRTTARADAEALCRAGLLIARGPENDRWYEPAEAPSTP